MYDVIQAQEEYIKFLEDELKEVVAIAALHGWKSTRVEEGERLRKLIADEHESARYDCDD